MAVEITPGNNVELENESYIFSDANLFYNNYYRLKDIQFVISTCPSFLQNPDGYINFEEVTLTELGASFVNDNPNGEIIVMNFMYINHYLRVYYFEERAFQKLPQPEGKLKKICSFTALMVAMAECRQFFDEMKPEDKDYYIDKINSMLQDFRDHQSKFSEYPDCAEELRAMHHASRMLDDLCSEYGIEFLNGVDISDEEIDLNEFTDIHPDMQGIFDEICMLHTGSQDWPGNPQ